MHPRSTASALMGMAALDSVDGKFDAAEAHLRTALEIVTAAKDEDMIAQLTGGLGSVLYRAGKFEKAKDVLFSANRLAEGLRPRIHLGDPYRLAFGERWGFQYEYLQRILVEQGEIEAALEVSERSRGRAFAELLLRSRLSSAEIPGEHQGVTIEEIRRFASSTLTTFVEYTLVPIYKKGGDSSDFDEDDLLGLDVLIYVVRPNGRIECALNPIRSGDLSSLPADGLPPGGLVDVYRFAIRSPFSCSSGEQVAEGPPYRRMYESLIQPIIQWLPEDAAQSVVIVPQLNLFTKPFATMSDSNGTLLVERNTIMISPSIDIHIRLHERMRVRLSQDKITALVIGDPSMAGDIRQLDFARAEALAIGEMYGVEALVGDCATKDALLAQIEQCSMVHIATHGDLCRDSSTHAPVLLVLAAENRRHVFLTPNELAALQLHADLIVLSACYSGLGRVTSDGVIGFARAMLAAGAATVVVALAKVKDESTSWLMQEFHRHYLRTGDKAAALRGAILCTTKKFNTTTDCGYFALMGERWPQKGNQFYRTL